MLRRGLQLSSAIRKYISHSAPEKEHFFPDGWDQYVMAMIMKIDYEEGRGLVEDRSRGYMSE